MPKRQGTGFHFSMAPLGALRVVLLVVFFQQRCHLSGKHVDATPVVHKALLDRHTVWHRHTHLEVRGGSFSCAALQLCNHLLEVRKAWQCQTGTPGHGVRLLANGSCTAVCLIWAVASSRACKLLA